MGTCFENLDAIQMSDMELGSKRHLKACVPSLCISNLIAFISVAAVTIHAFRSLKQHPFIVSQFLGQKSDSMAGLI